MTKPNCSQCTLRCGEHNIVWGEGERNSPTLFIIGEAPGAVEAAKKRPFVGDSGKLLRETLEAIKEQREIDFTYYLTNVVMCQPPGNRNPSPQEILNCNARLMSEIDEINPKYILLLGGVALNALCGGEKKELKITANRGKIGELRNRPFLATWHPSYVLRNFNQFQTFADDICLLLSRAELLEKYKWGETRKYRLLKTKKECLEFFNGLRKCTERVALDIETTFDIRPQYGKIVRIGFYDGKENVHIEHELFEQVKEHFPTEVNYIVHESLYEWAWFAEKYGLELLNVDDTLLMYHVLDERTKGVSKRLKTLAQQRLGIHDWSTPVKDYINGLMHKCPEDIMGQYLSYDCETTKYLYYDIAEDMQDDNVLNCYNNIIKPAIPFVNRMTHHGITIDLEYLENLEEQYETDCTKLKQQLADMVGRKDFNPGSYKQLGEYLYDDLKLKQVNGTSTDEDTINELFVSGSLSTENETFLRTLLKYREKSKMLGTYIKGLYDWTGPDSRIHSKFLLQGTETGRLSSRDFSLHTIPRPDREAGAVIRRAFLPDDGYIMIDADYAQLEARVIAHYSEDDELYRYCIEGLDIHKDMASLVFRKPVDQITKEERQLAKNGFFAVAFMVTPFGFVYNFKKDFPDLDVKLAERIIETVRNKYPKMYLQALKFQKEAMEHHEISTLFGRKRRFGLIPKYDCRERRDILKQASNTPIQGTASDICLLAGIDMENEFSRDEWRTHIIIHDGIIASAKDEKIVSQVKELMGKMHFETRIPFDVEVKVCQRWGE